MSLDLTSDSPATSLDVTLLFDAPGTRIGRTLRPSEFSYLAITP
jgi:hypothetical protein